MAAVCAPPASGGASAAAHEAIAIEIAAMRSTTQSKLADNAVLLAVADGAVAAAQKEAREVRETKELCRLTAHARSRTPLRASHARARAFQV
jgi:hypothetical protein